MRLLHHRQLQTNLWRHAPDDQPLDRQASTVSLQRWLREAQASNDRFGLTAVRFNCDDDWQQLADALPRLHLLVLEMSSFTDGRAFSTVRLLRERYGFSGEIRIRGEFLVDQIDAFLRAGADSFELPEEMDAEDARRVAESVTVRYRPQPVSRYRLQDGPLVVH